MNPSIVFNRASLFGRELEYVQEAIRGGHISGDGPFTKRCESILQGWYRTSSRVLLTTSCTHALEMAAMLLDVGPGDEVICPSYTFVSTTNAFVIRGARPVFIDIEPQTLNLNPALLESLITPRTRAVLPVHYAGVGCRMSEICDIADAHGVHVIEDNAHGLYGTWRGRPLGTWGSMATQSFHETKNVTCGEGGALVVNGPEFVERAEIIREKGTNRSKFYKGQVDKYTWVDVGSSYVLSDTLAAFLLGQLEQSERIQARRKEIWYGYHTRLANWANQKGVQTPYVPEDCDQAYHMYYLVLPSEDKRAHLIASLKARNVLSVFHYLPLHLSPMGVSFGGRVGDCPVTETVSARLLRLPFYPELSEDQQDYICQSIMEATKLW